MIQPGARHVNGRPADGDDVNVAPSVSPVSADVLATLDEIQRRVLWLATLIVHHANHVRPNPDVTKVGGHQASSASVVTILTALYFHFLQAGDRVSIKPHAAPAFHAIQYLLGRLPREYLTTLRAYHGLQAYPSRTKDPDPVDFSTGSVGLGAVAPAFAALAHRYAQTHFGPVTSRRFVALSGDAELDEGNVWEAVLEEALHGLGNLLWIVDLNRQSLDRVVPGIRAARLKHHFAENGWLTLEAKYGRALQALFAQPGGDALRRRIDEMSNEEYQALIRLPGPELRPRLTRVNGREEPAITRVLDSVSDADLPGALANLGGHDLQELLTVLAQADAETTRPTVIFAYTIKGWGLPLAGHPLNHSMLLSPEQMQQVQRELGVSPGAEWDAFAPDTPAGRLCAEAAARLSPPQATPAPGVIGATPDRLDLPAQGMVSTQDAFGRALVRLADLPGVRERIVTASPDVSISTNLAGWINKTGVFAPHDHPEYESEALQLLRWKPGPTGQHIELGISEMNLFMLLGMFGLAGDLCGQPLLPIGAVYDPFVCRGLDALIYGLYSGSRFICVGTPSGVSLAPEGGAHQSTVTPSLGMEIPRLNAYEPCFSREVEWTLLEALRQCAAPDGRATYLRLSTKPVDQGLMTPALSRLGEAAVRRQALDGGYRLLDWRDSEERIEPQAAVHIAAVGAMIPEAVQAARYLHGEGVAATVFNLVSPRRLYEAWRANTQGEPLDWLFPADERHAPLITVHDSASHALAWLGSVYGAAVTALVVDDFGQSGTRADLYRHYGLDAERIIEAAFVALEA